MKLRNLMYATMIACAFASCSKDDVIEGGQEPAKGDASFSVSVEVQNAKASKALGSAITGENKINTLAVFVYNEAKTQIIAQDWLDGGETTCTFTGLTAGQNVYVYAYANLASAPAPTSYGQGFTVSTPENGFSSTYLPMAGESTSTPLTVAGPNVATVTLVRSVARVDVIKLDLDVTKSTEYKTGGLFDPADFRQAIFNTKGFSVNGVPSTALTTGAADNCSLFIGGLAQKEWGNSDDATAGDKSFLKDYTFTGVEEAEALAHSTQTGDGETDPDATIIYAGGTEYKALVSYYVLPNKEGVVNLVLEGEFGYTVGNKAVQPAQSFYPIAIAKDGTVDGDGSGILEKNKLYRVSITVAGYGKSGGNKADLLVETEVSDYVPSTQKVVVE